MYNGNAHRLDPVHVHHDHAPASRSSLPIRDARRVLGRTPLVHGPRPEEAGNTGRAVERGEHERDPRVARLAEVCYRLRAGASHVFVTHCPRIHHQHIEFLRWERRERRRTSRGRLDVERPAEALRGDVDVPRTREWGCRDPEELLLGQPGEQEVGNLVVRLAHRTCGVSTAGSARGARRG
jgi:hypothetical protein